MLYHYERKMCINSEEIISICLILIVVFAIHSISHNFEIYYTPSPHPSSVRLQKLLGQESKLLELFLSKQTKISHICPNLKWNSP